MPPKWLNEVRKAKLIDLFNRSQGFCVFGHRPCRFEHHHYENFIEDLIKDWIAEDRQQRYIEWKIEQRALHNLGEQRLPVRGSFNTVTKDIFFADQPIYYIEGIGISPFTFKPFAKVRIASSFVRLYVDLGDSLKVNKNAKRKAMRYGRLTELAKEKIDKAVRHYLKTE